MYNNRRDDFAAGSEDAFGGLGFTWFVIAATFFVLFGRVCLPHRYAISPLDVLPHRL